MSTIDNIDQLLEMAKSKDNPAEAARARIKVMHANKAAAALNLKLKTSKTENLEALENMLFIYPKNSDFLQKILNRVDHGLLHVKLMDCLESQTKEMEAEVAAFEHHFVGGDF